MFDWLDSDAARKQEIRIRDTLSKLIDISNQAQATIDDIGDSSPQQKDAIHVLQEQLTSELLGPMPLETIKHQILDPVLYAPGVTPGAILAVNYVYHRALRIRAGK